MKGDVDERVARYQERNTRRDFLTAAVGTCTAFGLGGMLVAQTPKDDLRDSVSIVANSLNGTYFSSGRIRSVNLLFSKAKGLYVFGHSSILAISWKGIEKSNTRMNGSVWEAIVAVHSPFTNTSKMCQNCQVQSLCSGKYSEIPDSLRVLCEVRKFFTKVFIRERVQTKIERKSK